MKPTYQLAKSAAVFFTQYDYDSGENTTQEYRDARDTLRNHRSETKQHENSLTQIAAEILAAYVLSIPDQFEAGKRAGYADAQPQPEPKHMPSLFDRFGGPVK